MDTKISLTGILKMLWRCTLVGWIILCFYPIEFRGTRILWIVGGVISIAGATYFWWAIKGVRFSLLGVVCFSLVVVFLPGRKPDKNALAVQYCQSLHEYCGTRYLWGGEGFLGIDCSGLIRKGLFWAQLKQGLRTFNGGLIRDAISLWWNDCSALALRDGYLGWTRVVFREKSIASADHTSLKPGDLAVTADGVHILAYLGNQTWIEADPGLKRVVELELPTDNPWLKTPVVFLRWHWNE